MAGVYIHIPFCKSRCTYCDFHSTAGLTDRNEMIGAIVEEINQRSDFFEGREIKTLYIGGGTPSLLSIEQLRQLVQTIEQYVQISSLEEFTIELNPEDVTPLYARGLRSLGINRASIGLQSFDDRVLKLFGRRHTAQRNYEAVSALRAAGFDNISIDLIYGVGGFDNDVWLSSLRSALEMNVEHISAYHLTIDEGCALYDKLQRRELSLIDESQSATQYEALNTQLTEAGYEHYEVSNFARKGYRSSHNSSYWLGVEYLGIGASAHSFYNNKRLWSVSDNHSYIKSVARGAVEFQEETLSLNDHYNEFMMLSLRRAEGVELADLESRFGEHYLTHFLQAVEALTNTGQIVREDSRYYIPTNKFLVSDMIIVKLFND